MPAVEMNEGARSPLVLSSKPGQPVGRIVSTALGSNLLISATSKSSITGNLYLWALPSNEETPQSTAVVRPSICLTNENRYLFTKLFADGTLLATTSSGLSTFYQARCVDSSSSASTEVSLTKVSSSVPFDIGPTEKLSFNCSSPYSGAANEVAYALIDSQYSGRVSVLGVLSNQQAGVELIRDFYYPPVLGNLATSCAVRCTSVGGSPMLVIGDLTGRLHFFDLRLSSSNSDGVGVPIFTKAGSVKPITCICLHPFSSDTVIFGCEDGTVSMLDLRAVASDASSSAASQTGFAAHSQSINALAFNSTEPDQLFSVGSDGLLLEWAWTNQINEVPSALPVLSQPGVPLNCLAVDNSGPNNAPTIMTGSDFGDVFVIN